MASVDEEHVDTRKTTAECVSASTTSSQDPCRILRLPAELRNYIWVLALTPELDPFSPYIDVVGATLPGEGLVFTCREIRNDILEFYPAACDNFWGTLSFVFRGSPDHAIPAGDFTKILALDAARVAKIKHLLISGSDLHDFVFEGGSWSCSRAISYAEGGRNHEHSVCPCHSVLTDMTPGEVEERLSHWCVRSWKLRSKMERLLAVESALSACSPERATSVVAN